MPSTDLLRSLAHNLRILRGISRRREGLLFRGAFVALITVGVGVFPAGNLSAQDERAPAGKQTADFSAARESIRKQVGPRTPSLTIAVAHGGDILWEEGFGWIDRPGGIAATPDTLYYAASVTKAITATAVMMLHERRRLDLDRPANRYLKTAKLQSPHWNPDEATVRQLATHTAGLTTYDGWEQIPARETIRRYGILFWRPGDRFDYSNLGFGILGQVITDVSGRSFRNFVHAELLRPLGMTNAWAGARPKSRHAVAPRFSSLLQVFNPPPPEPTLPGASVLYCSARELALFGMFHIGTRRPARKVVLSEAGIAALQVPSVPAGSGRQSLAWSINDDQHGYRTLLAQGGTYDSQACLVLVPSEKIAVAVLANAGNVNVGEVIDHSLSALLPAYREKLATSATPASSGAAPAAPAVASEDVVGTWSGEIQTYAGNVPVVLAVTAGGEIEATLAKQPATRMTNVRFVGNRVSARMSGDLGIRYAGGAPYELRFAVARQEDKLIGAAVTYAVAGREGPRLPFWVELRRAGKD